MGKRKIQAFVKIEDNNSRNVTYCKRKRGLIKKAMELSMLCQQEVYLSIFDQERQKLVVYCSSETFNGKAVWKAENSDLKRCPQYERYTNEDHDEISHGRLRIEKTSIFSPSMQKFKLQGAESESDSNVSNSKCKDS